MNSNPQDNEFFPSGLEGSISKRLEQFLKDNIDSGESNYISFEELNNMNTATGNNLRRIGKNIGFTSDIADDASYRQSLFIYIMAKQTNGSIDYMSRVFGTLAKQNTNLLSQYIDIWQFVNMESSKTGIQTGTVGIIFANNVGLLIGSWNIKNLEGYVDFHLEKVDSWSEEYEEYVNNLRFLGRRVLAVEVLEVIYGE